MEFETNFQYKQSKTLNGLIPVSRSEREKLKVTETTFEIIGKKKCDDTILQQSLK